MASLQRNAGIVNSRLLLALDGAEEPSLHCHEALAHKNLGAAGALEALRGRVPVVLAVRHALSLGLHRLTAARTFLRTSKTEC